MSGPSSSPDAPASGRRTLPALKFADDHGVIRLVLRAVGHRHDRPRAPGSSGLHVLFSADASVGFVNPLPASARDLKALLAALERSENGRSASWTVMLGPEPGLVIKLLPSGRGVEVSVTTWRQEPFVFDAPSAPLPVELQPLLDLQYQRCPTCGLFSALPIGSPSALVTVDDFGAVVLCRTCNFVVSTPVLGGGAVHVFPLEDARLAFPKLCFD